MEISSKKCPEPILFWIGKVHVNNSFEILIEKTIRMGDFFLPLIVILMVLAIFVQDSFVLSILYLFAIVYILGRWWTKRSLGNLSFSRKFSDKMFPGEDVLVRLELNNLGLLPLPWVFLSETLPVDLVGGNIFRRVVTLGSKEKTFFEYYLTPKKRGYYQIGPLRLTTGDILGVSAELGSSGDANYLTVYPRVVSLQKLTIPSRSPMGTLRHTQPIFEDPTRIIGTRSYIVGDSLRRVNWKASAKVGELQVKKLEPSIALDSVLFLNFARDDYHYRRRIESSELAIVLAASLANFIVEQKQSVGICSNGMDSMAYESHNLVTPSRKGQGHLMRILEGLARMQLSDDKPFIPLLQKEKVNLSWGTTMIVITGKVDDLLFDELFQARRIGLNVIVFVCGPAADIQAARKKSNYFGISFFHVMNEADLIFLG